MRRAGVILLVIVGLLVVADFLLRAAAEDAAKDLVVEELGADVQGEIELGSFPFTWSLLTGRFETVTVDLKAVERGNVVVRDLHLVLDDVKLEALEVLAGRGDLRAGTLRGSGAISEADLTEMLGEQIAGVTVSIENGRVTLTRDGVSVAATAIVARNALLVTAGEVTGPIEIPLPEPLPGVGFTSARAKAGRLVLGVRGTNVRVRT